MPLSNVLLSGSYQIKLVSDQQTDSQPVTIVASNQNISTPPAGSPYLFSAQTDKTIYQLGDLIRVSGTGNPNTSIIAVVTSPSGKTYTSNTIIQPDGTYSMFYSTQSYETGNWYITVNNLGQSKVAYFTVVSLSSSTLTAQTDKQIYIKGDSILVSGTGASPYNTVSALLVSPSGNTYSASRTANSDGTFSMSFTTSQYFETGSWQISVTNLSQTKTISIFIQSE